MSTTYVTADVVNILRTALLSEIGVPACELDDASTACEMERRPDSFLHPLEEIDRHRAVLDVIGWSEPTSEKGVSLDLDAHRSVIARAMHTRLSVERDLMRASADVKNAAKQRRRARRDARVIERFLQDNGLTDDE